MKVCAIYARYSSDLQKATSIDDQVKLCEKAIRDAGWSVCQIYSDEEKSGTFMGHRPGFRQLMADARAKKFDYVVTEALDRLSRDLSDIAYFYKTMKFDDIEIYAVATRCFVTDLHISFEGLKNQQYSKDLAGRVRRGQRGATSRGRVMGQIPYGYRRVLGAGVEPGTIEIVEEQAKIIRRIYKEFAEGRSALAIAKSLNQDGIPSPHGKRWAQTVLCGSRKFGTGTLRNKLYIGIATYGKIEYRNDPLTHSRKRRIGTEIESQSVPHLQIINDELFHQCQEKLAQAQDYALNELVRPKRLLSSKVFCGVCESTYVGVPNGKLRCRGRTFDGICDNRRGIDRVLLEQTVINLLKTKLLHPELLKRYVAEYREQYRHRLDDYSEAWEATETRERRLTQQVDRLLDKIRSGLAEGAAGKFIMGEVNRLSADLEAVRSDLSRRAAPPSPPLEPDAVIARIGEQLATLQSWLDGSSMDATYARDLFRALIDRITLTPVGPDSNLTGAGALTVKIEGKIMDLMGLAGEKTDCIIQSRQCRLSGLDNTDALWQVSDIVQGAGAIMGGTSDVLEVLRIAECPLTAEALTNRVLELRGEVLTPARKRQIATRVRDCLKVHARRGLVLNVARPGEKLNQWVLTDRADEIAAAAPCPVIQVTETMTKALEILSQNPLGLSAKEIATKMLEASAIRVTNVKRHITYNRIRHSLPIYERAGIVRNLAAVRGRANKWVLGRPDSNGGEQEIFKKLNPTADFVHRLPMAKSPPDGGDWLDRR
jgi:DNA invertase Pin-like site-specific DNA recombinase